MVTGAAGHQQLGVQCCSLLGRLLLGGVAGESGEVAGGAPGVYAAVLQDFARKRVVAERVGTGGPGVVGGYNQALPEAFGRPDVPRHPTFDAGALGWRSLVRRLGSAVSLVAHPAGNTEV